MNGAALRSSLKYVYYLTTKNDQAMLFCLTAERQILHCLYITGHNRTRIDKNYTDL